MEEGGMMGNIEKRVSILWATGGNIERCIGKDMSRRK